MQKRIKFTMNNQNIEDIIKDNNPQNLNNYSIMAIFIQKLYSDAEVKFCNYAWRHFRHQ